MDPLTFAARVVLLTAIHTVDAVILMEVAVVKNMVLGYANGSVLVRGEEWIRRD